MLPLQLHPQASSPVLTPRRLLPDVPPPAGLSPRDIAVLQRQQEAALQRVLEEEILKEMNRENMLQAVRGPGNCSQMLCGRRLHNIIASSALMRRVCVCKEAGSSACIVGVVCWCWVTCLHLVGMTTQLT
jgi:hypothetical protein